MCKKSVSVLLRSAAELFSFLLDNKPVNPTLRKATYHTSGGWIRLEPGYTIGGSSLTTPKKNRDKRSVVYYYLKDVDLTGDLRLVCHFALSGAVGADDTCTWRTPAPDASAGSAGERGVKQSRLTRDIYLQVPSKNKLTNKTGGQTERLP